MHKSKIEYSATGAFSKLFLDYINRDPALAKMYSVYPELNSFESVIKCYTNAKLNRSKLVNRLSEQNKEAFPEAKKNIELLKENSTYTVCTGHQLCLFTGPLYFIFKIFSTINLSELLKKKYPENNFVPVYWMASEDHDFEEVNHFTVSGQKIEWNQSGKGAVGSLNTSGLTEAYDKLRSVIGKSENANVLLNLFESAYLKHTNLADATRWLVYELFGKYGLVVIDGKDKVLKTEFKEFLSADILQQKNFDPVNETISYMDSLGYKAQVNPRPINCFYLQEGGRERIEFKDEIFHVLNTSLKFTREEIEKELLNFPERFSPNVVLRPLYQQSILPNIAYVGGAGELAYWLEFKKTFDENSVIFPVLVPRNSVLFIDKVTNDKINKNHISNTELFEQTDILIKNTITKNSKHDLSIDVEEGALKNIFDLLKKKAEQTDVTLINMVDAEHQRQLKVLQNIQGKIIKAEKNKQEVTVFQVKNIKEKLFPSGVLQERLENFSTFYLKYGNNFFNLLKEELDPMDINFIIFKEE